MADRDNVIQTILSTFDNLSDTEKRIASFILENRKAIPDMAMKEIAIACETSSPTVSRLIKRLGYADFNDLRLALARSESAADAKIGPSLVGKSTGVVSFDRFDESMQFILSCKTNELIDTVNAMERDTIKSVVNLFRNSDTILITGVGNTLNVSENMAFKLRHLGYRALSCKTTESATNYALTMRPNDTIVIITSSGLSLRLNRIAGFAQKKGIPVVLITSNPTSPIAKKATHTILSAQRDRLFAYGLPFSHNSANFIIEVLFLFLHASSPEAVEHVELANQLTDPLDRTIDPNSGEFIGPSPELHP